MSDKLKPCPCCGGEAVIAKLDMSIYCTVCHCSMEWDIFGEREYAIKKWNTRAVDVVRIATDAWQEYKGRGK